MERVECSADVLEVKGAKVSSKSNPWITGRDTLGLSTTAETAQSRRAEGTGLFPRSDRSDHQSTTTGLTISLQRENLPKTCRNRARRWFDAVVTGMEMQ